MERIVLETSFGRPGMRIDDGGGGGGGDDESSGDDGGGIATEIIIFCYWIFCVNTSFNLRGFFFFFWKRRFESLGFVC